MLTTIIVIAIVVFVIISYIFFLSVAAAAKRGDEMLEDVYAREYKEKTEHVDEDRE